MWARAPAPERNLPGQPRADERRVQPRPQARLAAAVHRDAPGLRLDRVQRRSAEEGCRSRSDRRQEGRRAAPGPLRLVEDRQRGRAAEVPVGPAGDEVFGGREQVGG